MSWKNPAESINSLNPTNITNIFIPHGEIVPKANFATLKITLNVSKIFDETRKLCHTSKVIEEFVKKRTADKLSTPNKKVLHVIKENIKNLCRDDKEALAQIKSSFGLNDMELSNRREKRQLVVAATAIITSLVTYFSTKELISMSTDDEDSELYDTTNHIIAAVQNHETRLIRLEDKQKQLDVHLEKLAKALVLGIKNQDIL